MIKSELKDYGDIVYVTDYIIPKRGSVESAKIVKKPSLKCLFERFFMSEAMMLAYPVLFKGKAATINVVDSLLDRINKQCPEKSILVYAELRNKNVLAWYCVDGKNSIQLSKVKQWLDSNISKIPLLSITSNEGKILSPSHMLQHLQKHEKLAKKSKDYVVRIHTRNMRVIKTNFCFNQDVDRFIQENKLVDWPYCEVYQNNSATHYIYSQHFIQDSDVPKSFFRKGYKPLYQVILEREGFDKCLIKM